ncbi:MAG: glycosyltransferase family 2 protein [Chloroflexota bacterium]|nr:glycosyltransferase family 2 protein [Chloroflexota bacterium]
MIQPAAPDRMGESERGGARGQRGRRFALLAQAAAPGCKVSVVFPCRNEADSVASCVRDASTRMAAAGVDGEVIVCDNGSTDDSAPAAQEAGALVVKEEQPGYGRALIAGINAAAGEYIVIADADGSYDLSAVGPMVQALEQGADLVMGNRFQGRIAPSAMPWVHRYLGGPLFSALLRLFFGTSVGDVHCGMRAFTRDAYQRMALQTTGMEFASEMVARAARIGLKMAEVPVDYHPRAGESKLRRYRDGWRHLRFLLMYSPTWLYMIPSLALGILGISLLIALSVSDVVIFGRQWFMHLAAVASLLTVTATQIAWLGISARTLAVIHGFDPEDPFITRFYRRFTLEGGLALAAVLLLGGIGLGAWLLYGWAAAGFSSLDAIRPLLLAVTMIMVGLQSAFNAFFLSLLSVETQAVEPR